MRTPITVRVEAGLLAETRRCAAQENRTLTNFIETVLRRRVEEMASGEPTRSTRMPKQAKNGPATNAS